MPGSVTSTAAFDASAAEVFAYVLDLAHLAQFDPLVETARRVDRGPLRVGSRFEAVARRGATRMPLHFRVVELAAPRHAVLVGEGDGFREVDVIDVTDDDGCARLTWRVTVEPTRDDVGDVDRPMPDAVPRASLCTLRDALRSAGGPTLPSGARVGTRRAGAAPPRDGDCVRPG